MILFIVMKAYVGSAKLFGWADNRRMVHHWAADSPNSTTQIFEFRVSPSSRLFALPRLKILVCYIEIHYQQSHNKFLVFTQQLFHHSQNVIKGLFLSEVLLVWIQSFPSWLFVLPRLKIPVCHIEIHYQQSHTQQICRIYPTTFPS